MPQPLKIDPRKDRAWLNRALELAGEKRPLHTRKGKMTLGLLGKQILQLTPENRLEVQRLVARKLAEQGEQDND